MMPETLLSVESVSKKFCRSLRRSLWYGLLDLGSELIAGNGHRELRTDEFWALKNISLELRRGETLGLIGHNGAGKTTLLKILNGLIKPDTGRITVRGRIQALIALGAGFNPLLTGRENIYVNGAILGMSKVEIDQLFDKIVDFSGLEEFVDMPVQSYSSGMCVRLGFAIAAHLNPDILLVDEVLAVGDLAFRAKCQQRIQQLKQRGVAIVLVSHNLHVISHVCTRAIAFEAGRVLYDGEVNRAIDLYRDSIIKNSCDLEEGRAGTGEIRIEALVVLDSADVATDEVSLGDPIKIRLHYIVQQPTIDPVFNVTIHVLNGHQVTGIRTDIDGVRPGVLPEGRGSIDVVIPNLNLLPNIYTMDAVVFHRDGSTFYDRLNSISYLKVLGGHEVNGTAFLPHAWDLSGADTRSPVPIGYK